LSHDVIGLGALNIDLIATRAGVVVDTEDATTLGSIDATLARLRAANVVPEAFLGGSAFNALVMLAQLRTGLRLGMVGISGSGSGSDRVGESHAERLAALGIADLTRRSARRPGTCLALVEGHRRRLRAAPEANLEIADYLHTDDELLTVVASARVLHLTSLLEDPAVPGSDAVVRAVAWFVEKAKAANTDLQLSFDPGATWVDGLGRLPDLVRLYRLADVLYVSPQELALVRTLCSPDAVVVEKAMHGVVVRRVDGAPIDRVPQLDRSVAVDPTGAGDAVAAGVLAALGEKRSVVDGCHLGLRIASHRISAPGDRGHTNLHTSLRTIWPR
jgi:sugar/nucleoside kinase (ribokinase family)